jgi:hypothetical protein
MSEHLMDPRDMSRSALENELAVRREEADWNTKEADRLTKQVIELNARMGRIDDAVDHVIKLNAGGPSAIPGMETLRALLRP